METGLLLMVATLMVFGAREVQGTNHLSFSNATVNVTRDGCGNTKLCVANPENCDPNENNMCFLGTAEAGQPMPPNGTEVMFELAGYAMEMGFVALGITPNLTQNISTFFFCYERNDTFRFKTMERNSSGAFSASEPSVTEIRGNVTGKRIRCEFNAQMINATMMMRANAETTFSIDIINGTFNSNGMPQNISTLVQTPLLDLSNATSNIGNTTSAAGHLHATALLVLLSIPLLPLLQAA